jgi:hypothetical protein
LDDDNNNGNVFVVNQFVHFFYDIHSCRMQISFFSQFVVCFFIGFDVAIR